MELQFSQAELDALRAEYASNATDEQFTLWIEMCKRRGLVPVQDVVLQVRKSSEWDSVEGAKVWKNKAIYITTIGALRKIAERTGKYAGTLPSTWIYLQDGQFIESQIPLPEEDGITPRQPWAVRVSVKRKDFDEPITAVARFWAYAQTYKNNGRELLNSTWNNRGPEQLEKCGKAMALREAFPEELGGLYISEEFEKDTEPAESRDTGERKALSMANVPRNPILPLIPEVEEAPKVNHDPAEGTEEPRPGEKKKRGRKSKAASTEEKQPEPAPVENVHGLEVQDEDVPFFDERDDQQEPEGEELPGFKVNPKDNREPTKDEKMAIAAKLREYNVDKTALREWILRTADVSATNELTKGMWDAAFAILDAAAKSGKLEKVVNG